MYSRRSLQNIYVLTSLALVLIFARPTNADIVTVLFTGFNPDNPGGMDFFKDSIDSNFAADFPNLTQSSQVFAYNERNQAFSFINSHSQVDQLFLIGHSWGGNALIRLATELLLPAGMMVDATFQIDSVDIFGGGLGDNVLPSNVTNGYNFYQIPTGFLEPGGEKNVAGALNVNAEVFFNDPTISHTSIDNDTRLHDLFYARTRTVVINHHSPFTPMSVPEPGSAVLLFTALGCLMCSRVRF